MFQFGTVHRGHSFERLSTVYDQHVSVLESELTSLSTRLEHLQLIGDSIETNIRFVKTAKDERSAELQGCLQEMEQRLTIQLKTKLQALMGQKNECQKESTLLQSLIHELTGQLDVHVCPKSALINKTEQLMSMLQEVTYNHICDSSSLLFSDRCCCSMCVVKVHARPVSTFFQEPVSNTFTSELVPPYASSVMILGNFSSLLEQSEVVYSEPLIVNGLTWRLKVYPSRNTHKEMQ